MRLQKALGMALIAHAVIVGVIVIANMETLVSSSRAFAYPGNSSLVFLGVLVFNALLVIAPAALGAYLIKAISPSLAVVTLLSIVVGLYGGLGLILPLCAISFGVWRRYRTLQADRSIKQTNPGRSAA